MDHLLALRVFVRIAETGAFSRAADTLGVPRATASKLVQDLERHLGTQLLLRTTRRVSVTTDGAAYHERASRLVAELDDMDESVGRGRAQPRGRLRIDIGSSLANAILIPALGGFRALHPGIALQLGVSDRTVDLVGEGVDCAIRGGKLDDSALVARRIAELEFVTCASPGYLAARGQPRHPAELRDGHAVAGYFSSLTGKAFPLVFDRGGERIEVDGHVEVAVNESTAHISALLGGLGIGQTFRSMAAPHLASGALQAVLPGWTRPRMPLQLVYPSNRHLSARLRVFADWTAELFAAFEAKAGR